MSEHTTGLRSVLSVAAAYQFAQNAIGAEKARRVVAADYIRATAGSRVFDVGSGTSDILDHLPAVEYFGLEPNESYVEAARSRFGSRVTIVHGGVDDFDPTPWENSCDVVLSVGVMHHLTDGQAMTLLKSAARLLRPGGRFVAMDPCLQQGQSRIARGLIVRDRGQNVRTQAATEALIDGMFSVSKIAVRHDLLRLPYTHSIIEATV